MALFGAPLQKAPSIFNALWQQHRNPISQKQNRVRRRHIANSYAEIHPSGHVKMSWKTKAWLPEEVCWCLAELSDALSIFNFPCPAFFFGVFFGSKVSNERTSAGISRSNHPRCTIYTMVTCRRLTPGYDRKKRHVRHVHSRLHLARRFATHRAWIPKECFIDEKVRFNGVREQGFGVQIISGAHKPN